MRIRLLFLILVALAPAIVAAQSVPDGGDEETARRYAVEIIIFAYKDPDSVGSEVFVPPVLEDEVAVAEFGDAAALPAATGTEVDSSELAYRILTPDEYALSETWGMLSRLQAYEPLMHFGWVQDALPQATARPLMLDRFGTPPEGLAGSVSLALSRYLHLAVDLTLAAEGSAVPMNPAMARDPARAAGTGTDDVLAGPRYAPLHYSIKDTRIMKSGDTRYFDHPYFGVLARVTRADETDATLSRR